MNQSFQFQFFSLPSVRKTFEIKSTTEFIKERKTLEMEKINEKEAINSELAEKLTRIAFILKTIGHPTRLGIVHLLEQHPYLTVTEICSMLDSEQSLTSHHLQNMRFKGLLTVKREGRKMLYSLKERDVSLIIECLENCQCNM